MVSKMIFFVLIGLTKINNKRINKFYGVNTEGENALPIYLKLFESSEDISRITALRGMVKTQKKEVLHYLVKALNDTSLSVQETALRLLEEYEEILEELMSDLTPFTGLANAITVEYSLESISNPVQEAFMYFMFIR